MSPTSHHIFCSRERAQHRAAIVAWTRKIESELRDWAERLPVVDYNYLRLCLDDAAHRALYCGYSDQHTTDALSGADPFMKDGFM